MTRLICEPHRECRDCSHFGCQPESRCNDWAKCCCADSEHHGHVLAGDHQACGHLWFQEKADLPHYDLTRSKRDLAVSLGAVEADRRTTGEWMRRWRERRAHPGGVFCDVGVEVDAIGQVLTLRLKPNARVPMAQVSQGQEYTLHIQGLGEVTAHVIGYEPDCDGMLKEVLLTTERITAENAEDAGI